MKTWTNPEVEELEVKLTAGGCWPFFFESCLTHGVSCGCPNTPEQDPDGDGTNGDQQIPNPDDGELEEGTPS